MSVLVVGMSHRSAPVTILERVSMSADTQEQVLKTLVARESLSEAMVISTCNRIEVYAVTTSFHTGVTDIVDVLTESSGMDPVTLRRHLYVRYADAAAEHLFAVTSGLDSMVIGEQQIIGQVRAAYLKAHELDTAGPVLHLLAQCALHTGKRVHTETGIDDAGSSMVSFAFDEALRILEVDQLRHDASTDTTPASGANAHRPGTPGNRLRGKTAVVLGAGAMASLAASHLGKLGVDHLIVANRTRARADNLVEHAHEAGVSASAINWENRAESYPGADIIVSACGAGIPTVSATDLSGIHNDHPPTGDTPLTVCVDLSMPRDIPDDVAALTGVRLVNIEHLHNSRWNPAAGTQRKALAIIAEELGSYSSAQRVRDVVPAVTALRRHAASLIDQELDRLKGKTPGMANTDRDEVTRTVHRIVEKLLHQPTVRVKELAAHSGSVSYNSALQELFGLADAAPRRAAGVIHIDPAALLHGGRAIGTVDSAIAAGHRAAAAAADLEHITAQQRAGHSVDEQHKHTTTPHVSVAAAVPQRP